MKRFIFLILICIPVMLTGVPGITFSFANGQVTSGGDHNHYEFDVMAQKYDPLQTDANMQDLFLIITYNSAAFGENIIGDPAINPPNVVVENGSLLPSSSYGITLNDTDYNLLAICPYYTGNAYSQLPTIAGVLVHVQIEIKNSNQTSGLSYFLDYMVTEQYINNTTVFDPVIAGNSLDEQLSMINAPTAVAATAVCHNGFTARWNAVTGATSYRLDVYKAVGGAYATGFQDKEVALTLDRVEGLDVNTAYQYRVRAYNGSISLNSNIIDVSTNAETQGTSANTSIGGNPVTIDVPNVTGGPSFTNNDVIVAPGNTATNDYSVVVTWHPSGYDELPNIRLVCKVTCSDNSALNGVYTINHAGMGFTPVSAGYKWGGAWNIVACTPSTNNTTVTISGLSKSAKGELIIALDDGSGTLPVELSSFSAIATPQNYVMLQWVTQSETNVSGYYIFRNLVNNIGTAERINAFIPATNTSQETSYTFTDREATAGYNWYYWLQHVEMSGEFEFHGPVNLTLLDYTNTTPAIPLKTSLQQVYPNPFNPKTTIAFGLAKPSDVNLIIYNGKGEIVCNLLNDYKSAGNYRIAWEGKNNEGKTLPSGVYIVRMIAGKFSSTLKLVSLK